jgi:hypothetical protein
VKYFGDKNAPGLHSDDYGIGKIIVIFNQLLAETTNRDIKQV